MHAHERWTLATTTLLQIAIALSAITLLTRKRWLLVGVYGAVLACWPAYSDICTSEQAV